MSDNDFLSGVKRKLLGISKQHYIRHLSIEIRRRVMPPEATLALLNSLGIPKGAVVWECACGDGEMSRTIAAAGYDVISSDVENRGFGQSGIDFVTYCQENSFDWIITNPPFSLAEQFIRRAWGYKRPFAFLLRKH